MKYLLFSFLLILSKIGMGQSPEEAGIQSNLNEFAKAWNIHDSKAFSKVFAQDADFTNVRGVSAHGRADIEQFHAKNFTTIFKNSNLVITNKKFRLIRPDLAAVDALWEMTGSIGMDGKEVPLRKGLLNFLMTRTGDNWLILIMHNSDLPLDR